MASKLFGHALSMLWNNLGNAARVSVVPVILSLLIVIAGLILIAALLAANGDFMRLGLGMGMSGTGIAIIIIVSLAILVGYIITASWALVGWHRFVLLEEYPTGIFPKWHWNEIKAYILHMIVLTLITIAVAIPIGLVVSGVVFVTFGLGIILLIPAVPLVMAYCFRLATGLPARAIGQNQSIPDGWNKFAGNMGMIYGFCWLILLFSIAVGFVSGILQFIPVIGLIIPVVIQWFLTMFNASVLTTLYGHIVQGRELSDRF